MGSIAVVSKHLQSKLKIENNNSRLFSLVGEVFQSLVICMQRWKRSISWEASLAEVVARGSMSLP